MQIDYILKKLKSMSNPKSKEGMAQFGINTEKAFGISVADLRKLAKQIGKNHKLALELWNSGYHEARILASMIDEAGIISEKQMDAWAKDFNSWDLCDQCCLNLFNQSKFAYKKAIEWSSKNEEFVKRAGFSLMASLAFKSKKAGDFAFIRLLPIIKRESTDERNFVKKAVNWALRQIGKRNPNLNRKALKTAEEILKLDSKSAKWIATDAIRELESEAVLNRLAGK